MSSAPIISERVSSRAKRFGINTLPEGLELTVLDESGKIWRKTTAQSGDYYSQVGLTTPLGKGFTVELGLGDVRVRENFMA